MEVYLVKTLLWRFFSSGGFPAHQWLVVLDKTYNSGGFLIVRQVLGHWWQYRTKIPLGHRVVSPQQRLRLGDAVEEIIREPVVRGQSRR